MFQLTQKIFQEAEATILDLPIDNNLWTTVTKIFIFPYRFMSLGKNDFLKPVSNWVVGTFGILIIFSLASTKFELIEKYYILLFFVVIACSLGLTLFAAPSSYAYYGATQKKVARITKLIKNAGFSCINEVELFEQNLHKLNERTKSRINFYKWIIVTFWGSYLFYFNFSLKLYGDLTTQKSFSQLFESLPYFLLMLSCTGIALFLMVCYRRASEHLFKSIEFACVNVKRELL